MQVAAIIPHFNRRDLLDPLFKSLHSQSRRFDEIILVDNGSQDGSPALATTLGARVISLEKNMGFAAAVNRGIESSTADWIAILNNDVTLAPDWLELLLETTASFATGKILKAADHSLIDGTFDEISRAACAWRCGQGRPDAPLWNQPRQIRMAPMTAWMRILVPISKMSILAFAAPSLAIPEPMSPRPSPTTAAARPGARGIKTQ
jgi:glycosyltransferase involved in cell wall biosynthesis